MKRGGRFVVGTMLCMFAASPVFAQSVTPDYSALRAQSAALSKADRASAKQLFATGFTLWKSGDFASAEVAFKRGLDIDPANALANYYYGDCLARRKDKAEAKDYLTRAVALGGSSVESIKAQAELQQLSVAPTDVADMTQDEIDSAFVGHWNMAIACSWGTGQYTANITAVTDGAVVGPDGLDWTAGFHNGHVQAARITLVYSHVTLSGQLTAPGRIEGEADEADGVCKWTADKE